MRIVSAVIYPLKIPFKGEFRHNLHSRKYSDSIIIKLTSDQGCCGYGEAIARPYVTGETVEHCINQIQRFLRLYLLNKPLAISTEHNCSNILPQIHSFLSKLTPTGDLFATRAATAALEVALLDCFLKEDNLSFASLLPVKKSQVMYSAVISTGTTEQLEIIASKLKAMEMKYIKIKVSKKEDYHKVALIRDIVGPDVSLRIDANTAFEPQSTIEFINSIAAFNIDCIEQPIPRGNISALKKLKKNSTIPVMVDESLITIDDARKLINEEACDFFNIRISKCGGIYNSLQIAELAKKNNIKVQLGCHVGETAILSATGRHLAAYMEEIDFVEGSYSSHLLIEDISKEDITFGHAGIAKILSSPGLGIEVLDYQLAKYASQIITLQD
jgi:muconate cycloisomerase